MFPLPVHINHQQLLRETWNSSSICAGIWSAWSCARLMHTVENVSSCVQLLLPCPANTVSLESSTHCGSSFLVFYNDPWVFGGGVSKWDIDVPFRVENSTVAYSVHAGQSLGSYPSDPSLFIAMYCKKKSLWWGLEDAQILGLHLLWCHCKIRAHIS